MQTINNEVLRQWTDKGLEINQGIAVDARLVQSASHPISGEQIKQEQERVKTEEGSLDVNGKPVKFMRDIEERLDSEK